MVRKTHKIKICFFSPAAYPLFNNSEASVFGGAELQMYLLANKLSENTNYKIDFIVGNYGQNRVEQINNIRVIRSFKLVQKESLVSKFYKSILYFFILIKVKPDIIITTAAHATVGITAFYSKMFGKKHIHRTAHIIDVDLNWIKTNGIAGKLYKYGLERANTVFTQSVEHQVLLLKNHNINASVIRNGFLIKSIEKTKKNNILWVGRFVNWKNPELFLKLVKEIPDENFTMICPYSEKDLSIWKEFHEKASLIKNLKFIDKVPYPEIQEYFDKASVFVSTSIYEGYPNTFLQAAAGKTPIISLNVNPDNFITKYNCGYYCENNFELLVKKTKKLLQNKNKLEAKGENAYQYLKKNHDINVIGKQLEQIIFLNDKT